MKRPGLLTVLSFLLVVTLFVASCGPQPMVDCAWAQTAYAWLDENGNGILDQGEPPLAGVPFFVDDTFNDYSRVNGNAMTGPQGYADLIVWLPGCPKYKFEVYPIVPTGYRLTTPPRIAIEEDFSEEPYSFGFAYLPGVPTITPRPDIPLTCGSYPVPSGLYGVEHLLIEPGGIVWGAASSTGIFRFDPAGQDWAIYTEEDGLPPSFDASIFQLPDGTLWATTRYGIVSFDGSSWTTRRARDAARSTVHDETVFMSKETIWVVSTYGADQFDSAFRPMASYPLVEEGDRVYYIEHAAQGPDGTIWGIPGYGNNLFELELTSNPQWKVMEVPSAYQYSVVGIGAMSTGVVCFAGMASGVSGVTCFDPKTESWIVADNRSTDGALLGEDFASFAIAPDDSIWLGPYQNGVIQLKLATDDPTSAPQVTYLTDSQLLAENGMTAIAFAPDHSIWFGTERSIIHCTFK